MKNRNCKEWIWPPADQWIGVWGLLIIAGVAIVTGQVLDFFTRFTGMPWIYCYFLGINQSGSVFFGTP